MILRIASSRPVISLVTAIVVALCTFFIYTKNRETNNDAKRLALFEERIALPTLTQLPLPIEYSPEGSGHLLFRQVELAGHFLPMHEIYLENRVSQDSPEQNSKKISGYHIMMPFLLNSGQIVWVNRGWIAKDPVNRKNIPDAPPPLNKEKIRGYISLGRKNIFEMPDEHPHRINGHIVALNFYLHDDIRELPNRNVYPFLITETGKDEDGLIRPEDGFLYVPDYSFDLRTWWFTLLIAISFWFISGIVHLRNTPKNSGR